MSIFRLSSVQREPLDILSQPAKSEEIEMPAKIFIKIIVNLGPTKSVIWELSKTIETKKNIFAHLHWIIAKYVRAKSVLRGLQKFIWLQKVMWEEEKQRPSASGIAVAQVEE